KVRHVQVAEPQSTVGLRVGPHPPLARGREPGQLRTQLPAGIEELIGAVAPQPFFEQLQMHRVGAHLGERHLVRAKGPFDRLSIDLLRAGPALRRAQHDHRPARALLEALRARLALNALDLRDDAVQSAGYQSEEHTSELQSRLVISYAVF